VRDDLGEHQHNGHGGNIVEEVCTWTWIWTRHESTSYLPGQMTSARREGTPSSSGNPERVGRRRAGKPGIAALTAIW
jgi:hypothetical protein